MCIRDSCQIYSALQQELTPHVVPMNCSDVIVPDGSCFCSSDDKYDPTAMVTPIWVQGGSNGTTQLPPWSCRKLMDQFTEHGGATCANIEGYLWQTFPRDVHAIKESCCVPKKRGLACLCEHGAPEFGQGRPWPSIRQQESTCLDQMIEFSKNHSISSCSRLATELTHAGIMQSVRETCCADPGPGTGCICPSGESFHGRTALGNTTCGGLVRALESSTGLTQCTNLKDMLWYLSVNDDPKQGPLYPVFARLCCGLSSPKGGDGPEAIDTVSSVSAHVSQGATPRVSANLTKPSLVHDWSFSV
eukprot:TRINITY_DN12039_c0_g1_i3.p1 TRINITY_DN12039_c0_g1~~TRINITY_DN12039_c0_g1_i3.p1  ORF type:complete len:303 (-),score=48.96 TRINITY_DN12039_c0_g1_i3:200-1108(-)